MCDVPQPCGGAAAVRQGAEEGKAPEKDRSSLRNAAIASAVGASLAAVLAKKQAVGVATAPEDGSNGQTTGAPQVCLILVLPRERCGACMHSALTR